MELQWIVQAGSVELADHMSVKFYASGLSFKWGAEYEQHTLTGGGVPAGTLPPFCLAINNCGDFQWEKEVLSNRVIFPMEKDFQIFHISGINMSRQKKTIEHCVFHKKILLEYRPPCL